MDYEKKYKDALEWARKVMQGKVGFVLDDVLEKFPELKESEDERVRKYLKHIIGEWSYDDLFAKGFRKEDIIAWLEKQGTSYTKRDVDDAYLKGVTDTKNEIEKQYEANYQIRKDIGTFIFNYRGDIKDRAKWMDYLGIKVSFVEKQGEQNPYSGVSFKYNGHTWGMCARDNGVEILVDGEIKERVFLDSKPQGKTALEAINEENVDNANKVEPKFKVGDWITNSATKPAQISSIEDGMYFTHNDTIGGDVESIDKEYHLWTIDDAKAGDVLATDAWVFIFKELNTHGKPVCYCHYDDELGFKVDVNSYLSTGSEIRPATKEQRELLHSKIKEAGYEWDARKKELNKVEQKEAIHKELTEFERAVKQVMEEAIECGDTRSLKADAEMLLSLVQKPAWSEDDELHIRELESLVKQVWTTAEHENDKDIIHKMSDLSFFLKTLKPQPKQEWSEEDKNRFINLISLVKCSKENNATKAGFIEFINKLKSLSLQFTWKPSEKQIESLEFVIKSLDNMFTAIGYMDNYTKPRLEEILEALKKIREE